MNTFMKVMTAGLMVSASAVAVNAASHATGTLAKVQERGTLICGVSGGLPGFSSPDDAGVMQGIDADVCRAVAAAVLGDASKVEYRALNAKERWEALTSTEVDILSRNSTHTLLRDSSLGVDFTYYNYIDGQGFMVKNSLGVKSALELDGAKICVQAGTTTELNMADYFRSNKITFSPVGYETSQQTREGYEGGACDALTSDKSQLAALRSELKDPAGSTILPETISKEPLGPVVRQGDDQWNKIVLWSMHALINGEELGLSSKNIDSMKASTENPGIKRFIGTEGNMGELLGLDAGWAYNIIKQVGNYGEVYERTVAPLGIARAGSVNDLWTRGGLLYSPPIR